MSRRKGYQLLPAKGVLHAQQITYDSRKCTVVLARRKKVIGEKGFFEPRGDLQEWTFFLYPSLLLRHWCASVPVKVSGCLVFSAVAFSPSFFPSAFWLSDDNCAISYGCWLSRSTSDGLMIKPSWAWLALLGLMKGVVRLFLCILGHSKVQLGYSWLLLRFSLSVFSTYQK